MVVPDAYSKSLFTTGGQKFGLGPIPRPLGTNRRDYFLRFEAFNVRVVRCCVLVHAGNASKRGASVVGPTVLVGHRLKTRCGRLLQRCDCAWPLCAWPLLEVIRSSADAAACHVVLWGGRTDCCSVVDRRCCLVGVWADVSLGIPSRTTPTLRGDTVCLAECCTRPI